jgi:DNA-binding MarR family transcriptional regulator
MTAGLGTQLRHLVELLDGAVGAAYEEAGLSYRPRYTPVMRALAASGSLTLGEIAARAGITQPAATQTVSLMVREGLLEIGAGERDARQKIARLSPKGQAMLPQLEACWRATRAAADGLDAELPYPLSKALDEAIRALAAKPFGDRIRAARSSTLEQDGRERRAAAQD